VGARLSTVHTIDDVVARLDGIIAQSLKESSRLVYFATLYREMTMAVKAGIQDGRFQDGARMEALDVAFAQRYLDAYDAHRAGRQPTGAWAVAFRAAASPWPMILQHLLLGINAHINLDLGIAAARIAPGAEIKLLQHDFDQINAIIGSLTDGVQAEIDQLSPMVRWLDRFGRRMDEWVANFSIKVARVGAWDLATRLAPLPLDRQEPLIVHRDTMVHGLGQKVWHPGRFLGAIAVVGGALEVKDVAQVVKVLQGATANVALPALQPALQGEIAAAEAPAER
jgi:hypothetical protein